MKQEAAIALGDSAAGNSNDAATRDNHGAHKLVCTGKPSAKHVSGADVMTRGSAGVTGTCCVRAGDSVLRPRGRLLAAFAVA